MPDKPHFAEKYRPAWCSHAPFESMDYCWGLILDARQGRKFTIGKCRDCDDFDKKYLQEAGK